MGNLAPVALALLIVIALAVVGGVVAIFRHVAKYRAYQDLASDAQAIATALHGDVFRDGPDLVMSGNQGRWPVVVRWSHRETTPGLDIRMEAPASFTLWIGSKSTPVVEGRALLRTNNPLFDGRFSTRSDHPTQAGMLLAGREMLATLQKLCCSANTALAVTPGAIELSEDILPRPSTARHVLDHAAALARVADFLKTIPGAERFPIQPIRKERHILGRLAIAAGVFAAVLTVLAASKEPAEPKLDLDSTVPGVQPVDAALIANLANYRLAVPGDFDGAAVAWLRGAGLEPSARISADLLGTGSTRDVAYLLVDKQGDRRLVLLAGGADRYDIKLGFAGLIARIPKGSIESTEWVGNNPPPPAGDGVLIVRQRDDIKSGLVLFFSDARLVSAVPVNYQSLRLR